MCTGLLQQYQSDQLQKYLMWILLSAAVAAPWPETLLTLLFFSFSLHFPGLVLWLSPPPPHPSFLKVIVLRLKADIKTTKTFPGFETALPVHSVYTEWFARGSDQAPLERVGRTKTEKFFIRRNCTNHSVKTIPDLRGPSGAGHHQQSISCEKKSLGISLLTKLGPV